MPFFRQPDYNSTTFCVCQEVFSTFFKFFPDRQVVSLQARVFSLSFEKQFVKYFFCILSNYGLFYKKSLSICYFSTKLCQYICELPQISSPACLISLIILFFSVSEYLFIGNAGYPTSNPIFSITTFVAGIVL